MKITLIMIAALLMLVSGMVQADEPEAPPSFSPGAQVEMQITLQAPKQWKLNNLMPLTMTFDPEYLEDAPFTVESESLTIKLDSYVPLVTVVIPIKLKPGLADGNLSIPLPVRFSICNEVTDFCAFAEETVTIPVAVQTSADGTKRKALKSGAVEHSHILSVP